jgi:hypothetical protein
MTRSDWPEELRLAFETDSRPAVAVLVHVLLIPRRKNRFCIGPILTDDSGKISITAELMQRIIADTKADCPMDYEGELADCTGIEVVVEDRRGLEERLERIAGFYPEEARALGSAIERSDNSRFHPLRVTLGVSECHGTIGIELQTRP